MPPDIPRIRNKYGTVFTAKMPFSSAPDPLSFRAGRATKMGCHGIDPFQSSSSKCWRASTSSPFRRSGRSPPHAVLVKRHRSPCPDPSFCPRSQAQRWRRLLIISFDRMVLPSDANFTISWIGSVRHANVFMVIT